MGWARVVLVVVALLAVSPLLPQRAAAAPFFNGTCDGVDCGNGTCSVSMDNPFGFVCQCNPGWNQSYDGDHFRFLPCVIPECSINYACHNDTVPPPPLPSPPNNASMFEPCSWAYCGGGTCVKKSTFDHECNCNEGYHNLFNVTTFPCYRDCSLGADCKNLGITVANASSPTSSPNINLSDNGTSFGGDYFAPDRMLWLLMFMISFIMVRAA